MSFFLYLHKSATINLDLIIPHLCTTAHYNIPDNMEVLSTPLLIKNSLVCYTMAKLSFLFIKTPWLLLPGFKQAGNLVYQRLVTDIGILPVLNFYKDNHLNLISFSKTMRQSSSLFDITESKLSFSLYS